MQPSATSIQTLPSLTQSAALIEDFIATGVQTLPSLIQTAALLRLLFTQVSFRWRNDDGGLEAPL